MMRILALEGYYGGSHRAFLDGWCARSEHEWTVLGLPAYKWKWRMRHGAITFAEQVGTCIARGEQWDRLFVTDMLNLAEFLGLAPEAVRRLPVVAYFHENQLTYPVRWESERDYQYVFTNLTTALAADRVWFNSAYHRDSLLEAWPGFLKKMPDYQPLPAVERVRAKAEIWPVGIKERGVRAVRQPGPMRILWAARWEHDKNPECFFEALKLLKKRGVEFRVSVIGEQFREVPEAFDRAREQFAGHIDRWGYQESGEAYEAALYEADVAVSTADHEFFGLSMAEAVAAGAYPVVPRRLAYPEILDSAGEGSEFFYDGGAKALAKRLAEVQERFSHGELWGDDPQRGRRLVERFFWSRLAARLDEALAAVEKVDNLAAE